MNKDKSFKALTAIGIIILLLGLFMKTTVKSGINEVHNVGLMNDRLITIIIGGMFFIAGSIGIAVTPKSEIDNNKPSEKSVKNNIEDIKSNEDKAPTSATQKESAKNEITDEQKIETAISSRLKIIEEKLIEKESKEAIFQRGFIIAAAIPGIIILILSIYMSLGFIILSVFIFIMIVLKRNTEKPIIRGLIEMNRPAIIDDKINLPQNIDINTYANDEAYKIARANPYTLKLIKKHMLNKHNP
ncbi:MAG TPA: hypothetical protein PK347_07855 [Burkholderiaceae bacterium]|nr:hypothetical protein [Burkholderiaceae bacterium]